MEGFLDIRRRLWHETGMAKVSAIWLATVPALRDNLAVIATLGCLGINRVFVSFKHQAVDPSSPSYDPVYASLTASFIGAANNVGIRIHAMIDDLDPAILDPTQSPTLDTATATTAVTNVLIYNGSSPTSRFDGVHIDIEPWVGIAEGPSQDAILEPRMARYVELIAAIRVILDASSSTIELSALVAWWLNAHAKQGTLPHGAASVLANSNHLDVLVPGFYDDLHGTLVQFIAQYAADMIAAAPTIIGIGSSYATSPLLLNAINNVGNAFGGAGPSNYLGTSVDDYDNLPPEDPGCYTRMWLPNAGGGLVVEILFGVTNDGGGIIRLANGTIVPVPPWGPLGAVLEGMQGIIAALTVQAVAPSGDAGRTKGDGERGGIRMARLVAADLLKALSAADE